MRFQQIGAICFILQLLYLGAIAQENAIVSLRTRAEATAFRETSRYQDVMQFLHTLDEASDKIHLTQFGYTFEGRALPLVVVGADAATSGAVKRSGKVRVYMQGNIHAGEVCGKEALQMLLRSLAQGGHAEWTKSLVLLIAPIYNADGNERVKLTNRRRQHGPVAGMGQRPNAQNYDLNRDHMKLDSPEARSLVRLFNEYDPHVIVDLHTTDGSRHAYYLTYAPPLNPDTDARIDDFLRRQWLPAVTHAVRKKHGWDYYYYGNLPWPGMKVERGWYTFDHRPRFNNNYAGLRNRFGILSEAYSYATFEERVRATLYFVEEVVNFAAAHARDIARIAGAADAQKLPGTRLALRARLARSPEPVEILLGEVVEEKNPYSGEVMLRRTEARKPERMYEYGTFEATETGIVPAAYYVPARLRKIVDRVQAHGIRYTVLESEKKLALERFRIDSIRTAERPFQGHAELTLYGAYEKAEVTVEAGTLEVPVAQPLGRLVFYLLEPRSDDGVADWNLFGKALDGAKVYPILRRPARK